MNPLYEGFPDCVTVDGEAFPVVTDFRDWMRFFDLHEDETVPERVRMMLMLQYFKEMPPPQLLTEAFTALTEFAVRAQKDEDKKRPKSTQRVLSWSFDASYVYGAFLAAYRIDLTSVEYMHWHQFLALFDALPEDTPIRQRMYYRSVRLAEITDKKEKKRIRKIQNAIRIPHAKLDAYSMGDFF